MRQGKLFAGIKSLLNGSNEYEYVYSPVLAYNCTIKQLFQAELQQKFPLITLESIANEYVKHMTLPTQLLGKRSSEIMVSSSKKYCFKLLDEDSLRKLMEIMGDLLGYLVDNPSSYIMDIYRVFLIESTKENYRQLDAYILMPCLRTNFEELLAMYDLKGHTQYRNLSPEDFKIFKFGKDQNFIQSKQLDLIRKINLQERQNFVTNFIKDTNFLLSKKVIDYSLLISFRGINGNTHNFFKNSIVIGDDIVMEWAIIDYFQEYNLKKKAQNKIKTLFRKQVSSVEPEIYSERLAKFVQKYFMS